MAINFFIYQNLYQRMYKTQFLHLSSKLATTEKKAPRNGDIQLISLVDKCTQILRDDRIYLRSKIKEGDPEIIAMLRAIKKPINMQLLQINLRKFLQKAKSQIKMQHLTKFKQNLCEGIFQFQKQKKDNQIKKKLNSMSKKKLITNISEHKFDLSSQKSHSPILKDKLNSTQYFFNQSNRTANSLQKKYGHKVSNKKSGGITEKVRSTSNLINKTSYKSKNQPYKQHPYFFKHKQNISEDNRLDTSFDLNKTFNSRTLFMNSRENEYQRMSFQSKRRQTFESEPKFNRNDDIYTNNQSNNIKDKLHKYLNSNSIQSHKISYNQYLMKDNQNLRDLLLERRCIQQSSHIIKPTENIMDKFIKKRNFFEFSVNTKSIQINQDQCAFQQSDIQNDQIQISKNCQIQPFLQSFSEKEVNSNINKKITDDQILRIFNHEAEQLFQIIFLKDEIFQHQITLDSYKKLLSNHFPSIQIFEQFFSLADENNDENVTALQLGKIFEQKFKARPNLARDIYGLIDIERNGYFTWETYENFLNQIIQPEQENYLFLQETTKKLFENADLNKNGRVQYWGLYITKKSKEFQDFTEYLQGFQFQIQV